jgi:hypothetical protein
MHLRRAKKPTFRGIPFPSARPLGLGKGSEAAQGCQYDVTHVTVLPNNGNPLSGMG